MTDITPRDVIADAIIQEATNVDVTDSEAYDFALNALLALSEEYGTTVVEGHHYILVPHIGLDAYPKRNVAA